MTGDVPQPAPTNPFGVPETLSAARSRLPVGDGALVLAAANATAVIPTAVQLDQHCWVTADCVLWTWSPESLAELSAAMRSAGDVNLAFVEPTAGLGLRHRAQLAAGPWLARRTGHRHHRDIPHELRQVGFVVTTTVRFTDGIGHYVWGEARHYHHPITTR